jgi:hypothetical protein
MEKGTIAMETAPKCGDSVTLESLGHFIRTLLSTAEQKAGVNISEILQNSLFQCVSAAAHDNHFR